MPSVIIVSVTLTVMAMWQPMMWVTSWLISGEALSTIPVLMAVSAMVTLIAMAMLLLMMWLYSWKISGEALSTTPALRV
jgi:hypothetical protein